MSDQISGTVEIVMALADDAAVEPSALVDLISTWVGAVELGLFGPGRLRLQGALETQSQRVRVTIECEHVPQAAFRGLSRMVQHFSKVRGRVESFELLYEGGQRLVADGAMMIPGLPQTPPFTLELPTDLHAAVRVEIEFRSPLAQSQRDAVFDALAIWDRLVEVLGDEEQWGERVDRDTRLLSPRLVEHEVIGYFASFECLHFVVLLGLRLHQRLSIERITIES